MSATSPQSSPPIASELPAQNGSVPCFHCGEPCRAVTSARGGKSFCCQGCETVHALLTQNGLDQFYEFGQHPGVRTGALSPQDRWRHLDDATLQQQLLDFTDGKISRVTFHIPSIHCLACVWLLENLFRLKPGIGHSQVNFPQKEVGLSFENAKVKFSEIVSLLASLGYEPELKLAALDGKTPPRTSRRLWIQLALAGFGFGNIMLFSIAAYFGLDAFAGPAFRALVGFISLLLALPVVTYSAFDYWRAAWVSLRQRLLNIDVPIAAGIAAIFAQSCYEVLSGRGEGYFDSLCGLIFFLLCGRLFQRKTFERLAFDRDYKSFFPLSVTRKTDTGEEQISLSQLGVGDHLVIRNGELIPADGRLIRGSASIDYSFVTGESEPVEKQIGEHLYAGGRQRGGILEIESVKPVSQSYLTSLWNQDAFRKDRSHSLDVLTNTYSQRFTQIVMVVALGAALFWAIVNPALSLKAAVSVLIVACPCALALAAPFSLGTALRVLARRNVFLKNPDVVERLARVNAVVFDKTGTLTTARTVQWLGAELKPDELQCLHAIARQSTHPLARLISKSISSAGSSLTTKSFYELEGLGLRANVGNREICLGSAAWLASQQIPLVGNANGGAQGSVVHVAMAGQYRGAFALTSTPRAGLLGLTQTLSNDCELALLSGDNEREREKFRLLFNDAAHLRFNQSPQNKLAFIDVLQQRGKTVMMVGDGLNDAGALKQSDVGVAVVEDIGTFSPASDVILTADMVSHLARVRAYARQSVRVVRAAFFVSAAYNFVGLAIAASGKLSPIVCAILMPLSSVTVVAFAIGATTWLGRTLDSGFDRNSPSDCTTNAKRMTSSGESEGAKTALLSRA